MNSLCLLLLLATAVTVVAGGKPGSGPNHHHYYATVTNNVHHHQGKDDHHDDDHHDDHHDYDDHHDDHHDHDDHSYRFHISDDGAGPYAYLDDEGLLRGGFIDLIRAVCKEEHKRCYYMMDEFQRCWEAKGDEEHPGAGLLYKAYDACIGLSATPERRNSFDFTEQFAKTSQVGVYFVAGKVPKLSNPMNLTTHSLGFINGWSLNPKCIRRHKAKFSGTGFTAKYYDTQSDMFNALQKGEVEAIVTGDFIDADALKVEQAGPQFECGSGLSVMAHYGNDVIQWFNHGINKLVERHGWKKLCANAAEKHGAQGNLYCLED